MLLQQYTASFGDTPLTDDQTQRLLQVMIAERKSNPMPVPDTGAAGGGLSANTPALMAQNLQNQDVINQDVLADAAAFLTPAQLQTLAGSQSNMLSMQRMGLTMMQKMMGSPSNAAPADQ